MSATALQFELDLAPGRRPPLRLADPASTAAAARALGLRTPSGDAPGAAGRGLTLDETLVGVWEGLLARRTVRCPVCRHDAMGPAAGGGGHCGSCHAQLS